MHHKITFKIKNWRLNFLALLMIAFLTWLGCWQLSRAKEKMQLLSNYAERTKQLPLSLETLAKHPDPRFHLVKLTGEFDNQHTFLLDNKTYHGQVGYEIYTPFHPENNEMTILVDRGFLPASQNRQILPQIKPVVGTIILKGMINMPPHFISFGEMINGQKVWPQRIEFIDVKKISALLNSPIETYVINIDPQHLAAFNMECQIVTVQPERHQGYAVQWFALALTLLILSFALNRHRPSSS